MTVTVQPAAKTSTTPSRLAHPITTPDNIFWLQRHYFKPLRKLHCCYDCSLHARTPTCSAYIGHLRCWRIERLPYGSSIAGSLRRLSFGGNDAEASRNLASRLLQQLRSQPSDSANSGAKKITMWTNKKREETEQRGVTLLLLQSSLPLSLTRIAISYFASASICETICDLKDKIQLDGYLFKMITLKKLLHWIEH